MKPYLYFSGLLKLVADIKGSERIHVGIRPYGFHAGNSMALVVYPYLLCKYTELAGKKAQFRFIVSINDWEQDALDGPNPRKYPFNVYPKNTSIFYLQDDKKCCKSAIDHWQPIIERAINTLKVTFPHVTFEYKRNSDLIKYPFFKTLLLQTLKFPMEQFNILISNSHFNYLNYPIIYAGAVCPQCYTAHGITSVIDDDTISWACSKCYLKLTDNIDIFQFWWYHKPMLIARIKIFKIDIILSGGDHYSEGDFNIRKAFLNKYTQSTKEPYMLFTPTVIALDGQKMSKGRNNTEYANIQKLIEYTDKFMGQEIIISKKLIDNSTYDKNHSFYF